MMPEFLASIPVESYNPAKPWHHITKACIGDLCEVELLKRRVRNLA